MLHKAILYALAIILVSASGGCAEVSRNMQSTWHQKCGWKAEDYFDDPQVIELCRAIEANDLAKIDRLVAAGADLNAQGKGKMTPLLWAFPDNKLERFKRLLEHGANPNVIIESDFNTRGGMSAGDSVTQMACRTAFPGYFDAVFDNGGNPSHMSTSILRPGETPLFAVIKGNAPNKKAKIKLLIEKKADLDHKSGTGRTAVHVAVGRGHFEIASMLLEAGADYKVYLPKSNSKLIHFVVEKENLKETWSPQQKTDYERLVEWLEKHGESTEQARVDNQRWESWSLTTGEFQRKMAAEVAARRAREAREKAAAENREQQGE